jgi:hypothetical protein
MNTDFRLDKSAFRAGGFTAADDREYWAQKSPLERLEALEFLRQVQFGYDPATARLQRVLTITQLRRG